MIEDVGKYFKDGNYSTVINIKYIDHDTNKAFGRTLSVFYRYGITKDIIRQMIDLDDKFWFMDRHTWEPYDKKKLINHQNANDPFFVDDDSP